MRISDWSSDVCSSDLAFDGIGAAKTDVGLATVHQVLHLDLHVGPALAGLGMLNLGDLPDAAFVFENVSGADVDAADLHGVGLRREIGRASCRERVCQYA